MIFTAGWRCDEQSIKQVSNPAFFMRIATLSDESADEAQKAKLAALASNLVAALEVVVQVFFLPQAPSLLREHAVGRTCAGSHRWVGACAVCVLTRSLLFAIAAPWPVS